jgi:hypothetical protein
MSMPQPRDTERPYVPDDASCFGDLSVFSSLDRFKGPYKRLVLISCDRHANVLDAGRSDTLALTTDWLVWRRLSRNQIPCLHLEAFLGDWPQEAAKPERIFLEAASWSNDESGQPMLFQGIPLGRIFTTSAGFTVRALARLWHGLDRACAHVQPSQIVLYDLFAEFGMIEPQDRRTLVHTVALKHHIFLEDRFDPLSRDDASLPEESYSVDAPQRPSFKRKIKTALAKLASVLSAYNPLAAGSRPVFVLHNWNTVSNLISSQRPAAMNPALQAESISLRPAQLWHYFINRVRLVSLPNAAFTPLQERDFQAYEQALLARLERIEDALGKMVATFIRNHFIDSGFLRRQALLSLSYERMLSCLKPASVLIGDGGNVTNRVIAQVAAKLGLPCNELLNGVFVCAWPWDIRGAEPGFKPPLTRFLTWGAQNEHWLEKSLSTLARSRTGYPALDRTSPLPRPSAERKTALLLPLSTEASDVTGLRANIFTYLAGFARMLCDLGYEVRIKLHPGRPNAAYFTRIIESEDIGASVVKDGTLASHLEWASLVVGPVNSGAMVETLAAGRPYYAVLPQPSSIDPALCGPLPLYTTPQQLAQDIKSGVVPDAQAVLDFFCDISNGPASPRVWDALNQAA